MSECSSWHYRTQYIHYWPGSFLISLLFVVKTFVTHGMNECMKVRNSFGHIVEERGGVSWLWGGNRVDRQQVCTPPWWPLSCLVTPYHWPAKLKELPAPVAMATSSHGEMSQLLSYYTFHRRQSVCLFLLYILLPATRPPACTLRQSLQAYVSALHRWWGGSAQ